jgi:hypothetical protein
MYFFELAGREPSGWAITLQSTLTVASSVSALAGGDFDFNVTHCAGEQPGGCGAVFEVQP